jgi:hypothetical protein
VTSTFAVKPTQILIHFVTRGEGVGWGGGLRGGGGCGEMGVILQKLQNFILVKFYRAK